MSARFPNSIRTSSISFFGIEISSGVFLISKNSLTVSIAREETLCQSLNISMASSTSISSGIFCINGSNMSLILFISLSMALWKGSGDNSVGSVGCSDSISTSCFLDKSGDCEVTNFCGCGGLDSVAGIFLTGFGRGLTEPLLIESTDSCYNLFANSSCSFFFLFEISFTSSTGRGSDFPPLLLALVSSSISSSNWQSFSNLSLNSSFESVAPESFCSWGTLSVVSGCICDVLEILGVSLGISLGVVFCFCATSEDSCSFFFELSFFCGCFGKFCGFSRGLVEAFGFSCWEICSGFGLFVGFCGGFVDSLGFGLEISLEVSSFCFWSVFWSKGLDSSLFCRSFCDGSLALSCSKEGFLCRVLFEFDVSESLFLEACDSTSESFGFGIFTSCPSLCVSGDSSLGTFSFLLSQFFFLPSSILSSPICCISFSISCCISSSLSFISSFSSPSTIPSSSALIISLTILPSISTFFSSFSNFSVLTSVLTSPKTPKKSSGSASSSESMACTPYPFNLSSLIHLLITSTCFSCSSRTDFSRSVFFAAEKHRLM
ncbi:unnamed protein product [Moneuplotes crassus]|uniref:Uncharacterized protein n=1 Tax=Euplotes crassus TaxID=5936 RepID=A0AAD1XDC2_EUPCR|nr:unnamed protein product [Moneuplotes crassus]